MTIEAPSTSNGFATTALVLGIIGALTGLIPFFFFLAVTLGVLAVVFGGMGYNRVRRHDTSRGKGAATAGFILGVVALVLGIVGFNIVDDAIEDLGNTFDSIQDE